MTTFLSCSHFHGSEMWQRLGSSYLGFSCSYSKKLARAAVIWRSEAAECPRWLAHKAGSWCWLSTGSPAGAVNQGPHTWPLRYGCIRLVGLLAWQLASIRVRDSCLAFSWTRTQKSHNLRSHTFPLHSTGYKWVPEVSPDTRGVVLDLISQWHVCQRICRHVLKSPH